MVSSKDSSTTDASSTRAVLSERLSAERERFEALLSEVRALQTGGYDRTPRPSRRRRRSMVLVDVVVMMIVVYALIVGTPLGSLVHRAWAWAIDSPEDVRPLLSYFSQPTRTKIKLAPLQEALQRAKGMRRNGARPTDPLPVSVAFLFAEGVSRGDHFDVRLPTVGRRSLASVAVVWPGDEATAKQRETALYEGLTRLRRHLGADEAAVAALAVNPDSLAFALERARVTGVPAPGAFEAFGRYLPHEDRRAAAHLVHSAFALARAYALTWPIQGKRPVTSRFGMRSHPVLGERRLHKGVDIGVPVGTPVLAMQSGTVTFVGYDGVNGHFLRLDHGHGLTSTYCHLKRVAVARGAKVLRGAKVAASGNSGRSTGPHLHFQVELSGTPVDPELFR